MSSGKTRFFLLFYRGLPRFLAFSKVYRVFFVFFCIFQRTSAFLHLSKDYRFFTMNHSGFRNYPRFTFFSYKCSLKTVLIFNFSLYCGVQAPLLPISLPFSTNSKNIEKFYLHVIFFACYFGNIDRLAPSKSFPAYLSRDFRNLPRFAAFFCQKNIYCDFSLVIMRQQQLRQLGESLVLCPLKAIF